MVKYEKKNRKNVLTFLQTFQFDDIFFFHLEFVETSCICHYKSYLKHAPSLSF